MCQYPITIRILSIQDRRSWRILDLMFLFYLGILEILDPVTAALPWDPRNLGSRAEKMLNPGDPGLSPGELSWDLADLGSYTTICHYLYPEDPLHP